MRVRAEAATYTHTNAGKARKDRGYALVNAATGQPLFVGLFVDPDKAESYCKGRGWGFVK